MEVAKFKIEVNIAKFQLKRLPIRLRMVSKVIGDLVLGNVQTLPLVAL